MPSRDSQQPFPAPSQSAFSRLWHRSQREVSRAFGGNYGRAPDVSVEPDAQAAVHAGEITLQTLRWHGEGTPLVLLHGLNNNAWSWARVASQLRGEHRIVAVSLRGHGGSTAPERGYSLADTTLDIVALLDALGLERVHLAGHSWGGKVACHVAASVPDRIVSLSLADPAPPKDLNPIIRSAPWLVRATLRPERGPFASRAAWEEALHTINYLRIGDATDRRLWRASFVDQKDGTVQHCLPESAHREILEETLAEDIRPLLRRIRCPGLLMLPTFTLSFLPGEMRSLHDAVSPLHVERMRGDHTFMHTNAIDTAAVMERFLASLTPIA